MLWIFCPQRMGEDPFESFPSTIRRLRSLASLSNEVATILFPMTDLHLLFRRILECFITYVFSAVMMPTARFIEQVNDHVLQQLRRERLNHGSCKDATMRSLAISDTRHDSYRREDSGFSLRKKSVDHEHLPTMRSQRERVTLGNVRTLLSPRFRAKT
jgi:hypothetical protein